MRPDHAFMPSDTFEIYLPALQGLILLQGLQIWATRSLNDSEVIVQERLAALQLNNRVRQQELEKEYVKIDFKDSPSASREGSQTVSISAAEQWEKEILEDPKNRYVYSLMVFG